VGCKGENLWVRARRWGEILRRENFITDLETSKVNGGSGSRKLGF